MFVVTLNGKPIVARLDTGNLIARGLVVSDSLRKPTVEESLWTESLMQHLSQEPYFTVGE